jgi:protein gp37
MGTKTGIEWTDATWNPIIGCSRVSEGCRNCYAEGIAGRFGQGKPTVYSGLTQIVNGRAVWTGKIAETKQLLQPLSWRQPKRVFVNSMSDLFHENVTDEQRDKIFAVMALCPQHTFQVLTKRPENMLRYFRSFNGTNAEDRGAAFAEWCIGTLGAEANNTVCNSRFWMGLPNVWLGVSVENQDAADNRIEWLLRTPAAVRFLSVEPMLGPVNLNLVGCECDEPDSWDGVIDCLGGFTWTEEWDNADGSERTIKRCQTVPKIDWVICGGESGPNARPMHPDWVRSLRDQCQVAGVPFFFKQWGEWLPALQDGGPDCPDQILNALDSAIRVGKKAAGALLDGREWKQFPGTRISTAEISEPTYRNGCPILQP